MEDIMEHTSALMLVESLQAVTAAIVGLFAGAMLTEGGLLVPYWRSLAPEEFSRWYRRNGARLVAFFGPLTWAAGLSALASALIAFALAADGRWGSGLSAALMLGVVAMFPLYFEKANAAFAATPATLDGIPRQLSRWAAWHWVRTAISGAALIAAIVAAR
jgi:hypothetical protein